MQLALAGRFADGPDVSICCCLYLIPVAAARHASSRHPEAPSLQCRATSRKFASGYGGQALVYTRDFRRRQTIVFISTATARQVFVIAWTGRTCGNFFAGMHTTPTWCGRQILAFPA